jgi:hypothetical protein
MYLLVLINLNDVYFVSIQNPHFFQVIWVLSIVNHTTPPFQKVCGNCHVTNIIILPTSDVHCNVCHSKSKVGKFVVACVTLANN